MENHLNLVTQKEGDTLAVAGGNYRIIIPGTMTNGNYAVIEMTVPPGGGPPPHVHPKMQETFYVLEGEVEFRTPQGKALLRKGDFVNIPLDGEVHCFKNRSTENIKLLCTVIPAGLDEVFKAIGVPVESGSFLPPPALTEERKKFLLELDQKYGQTTYPPDYLDQ